jgi:effector-binding domain-containing protein
VAYDVRVDQVEPRPLAAIRAVTTQAKLSSDIIRLLNIIWPVLRDQPGVQTGHNVVIYYGGSGEVLTIDVGVEARGAFVPSGDVQLTATPAGEVATAAHFGDYSEMGGAYDALGQWCAASGRVRAEISWEVYGDWEEDPAKRRTDVFFLLEPTL